MNGLIERARRSIVGRLATSWGELHAGEGAILIAWQLLFSLFPLVVGLLAILGLILRNPDRLSAIAESIASQFPEQASDLVGFIVETRELGGIFGVVSVLGLLWSGSNLFGTMATVFNRFYGVPDRGFVRQRLMSFAMMAVYAVLITVSVAATSIAGFLAGVSEELLPFDVPVLALVSGWAISLGSAILMFLALYRVVPNARLRVWHVWKGAVLAGVAFVVLSQIFPLYLQFLGGGFAAYKALGVFLLLMTWFYFLSMILCAGALLNALRSGHRRAARAPDGPAEDAGHQPGRSAGTDRRHPARSRAAPTGGALGDGPIKVLAWASLTAAVSGLILLLARRAASAIWRALLHQEPPG